MILLTDEEIIAYTRRDGDYCELAVDTGIWSAKAQLKEVVELLEDALENSFVMAYVGEDAPYESTIDPITIREIISDMRQALLKEVKEYV